MSQHHTAAQQGSKIDMDGTFRQQSMDDPSNAQNSQPAKEGKSCCCSQINFVS